MKIVLKNGLIVHVKECRKFSVERGELVLMTTRGRELAYFRIDNIAGYYYDCEVVAVLQAVEGATQSANAVNSQPAKESPEEHQQQDEKVGS